MNWISLRYSLLIVCLFLGGCVSMQPTTTPAANQKLTWQKRSNQLEEVTSWTINGSTSITRRGKTDMASVSWNQQGGRYTLTFLGPLSLGRVQITGAPGAITLARSNHAPVSAKNPEQLMQQQLGWHMPISSLYYWVRGLSAPNSPAKTQLDPYEHLSQLNQEGWNIRYLKYTNVNGIDLPSLIALNSPELQLRLVIKQWQIR